MKLASISLLHIHQTYQSGIRDGRQRCPQQVAPVRVEVNPIYKDDYLAAQARSLLNELSINDLLQLIEQKIAKH